MVIFALFERRQCGSFDLDELAAQGLGGRAVRDTVKASNGGFSAVSNAEKTAFHVTDVDILMRGEARCAVAEQLQPNLALHSMRAGHCGKCDALIGHLPAYSAFSASSAGASSAAPSAGSSLETPSASATGCSAVSAPSAGASSTAPSAGSDVDSAAGASSAAASASAGAVSATGGVCSASSSTTCSASAVGSSVAASISAATTA